MKIISVPHPHLHQSATQITHVDQKLKKFINNLGETLRTHRNPVGVGLAAPQVDVLKRIFVTNISKDEQAPAHLKVYINPTIVDHSQKVIFGPHQKDEILEGCLSIPKLYGPVPRFEWVQLEYQIVEGDQLSQHTSRFDQYEARVIQHELDHLDGILFTDYSLKYDLPVYQENPQTKKFEEIDKQILTAF